MQYNQHNERTAPLLQRRSLDNVEVSNMKKSFWKKMLTTALAICLCVSCVTPAFACTGVYVGGGVTENGSSYMGRSEDIGDRYGKVFGVAGPQTITADSVFEDTYGFSMKDSDLEFDYPSTTYSYTYVRDSYQYGESFSNFFPFAGDELL